MIKGKIVQLAVDRGYGFIEAEDGRRVFFHRSMCGPGTFDQLVEGDEVQYEQETAPSPKGPRAKSVALLA